jgi:hypothetical protein
MSSGSASHKSTSIKPNVNANGVSDPDPDVPTEIDYSRDDQEVTPANPAVLERPTEESAQETTQK